MRMQTSRPDASINLHEQRNKSNRDESVRPCLNNVQASEAKRAGWVTKTIRITNESEIEEFMEVGGGDCR